MPIASEARLVGDLSPIQIDTGSSRFFTIALVFYSDAAGTQLVAKGPTGAPTGSRTFDLRRYMQARNPDIPPLQQQENLPQIERDAVPVSALVDDSQVAHLDMVTRTAVLSFETRAAPAPVNPGGAVSFRIFAEPEGG